MKNNGTFVISLDFEMYWGIRDKRSLDSYSDNILEVWNIIPKTLKLFNKHDIKATFATVGLLFAQDANELQKFIPDSKPNYDDPNLSPYSDVDNMIQGYSNKYFFTPELIDLIRNGHGHEISSHTFSHFYCQEKGQTREDFENDISSAVKIANSKGVELKSIVFPRNQFNNEYLGVLKKFGIMSYRGNERSWLYSSGSSSGESFLKRGIRLIDAYVNLTGHNCYSMNAIGSNGLLNVPSSRFLRPYSRKLRIIEKLKIKRILNSMTYAARNGEYFHLWWHPHNFGSNQSENFKNLKIILNHYDLLKAKYGFKSKTMHESLETVS